MRLSFRFFCCLLFWLISVNTEAQDGVSVLWKSNVTKTSEKKFELSVIAKIKQGWRLYPSDVPELELNGLGIVYPDSSIISSPKRISGTVRTLPDPVFEGKKIDVVTDSLTVTQQLTFSEVPQSLQVRLIYNVADGESFIPEEVTLNIIIDSNAVRPANRILIPSVNVNDPIAKCGSSSSVALAEDQKGLGYLFLLGFVGGLLALITPCVFPMIPLTVSFFTKKAASKAKGVSNAFVYGFFIFLIYILLSLPFHFISNIDPEILNNVSTNVGLNIFFFLIFILFAFSFFGYYDIVLPSRFTNATDSKSNTGNFFGIFFMALTLALVSFSCTGPILGSLLAGSLTANGGAMQLTAGMGGFGLALALPFALFAMFPNWLNTIPKSGGWLNTVKVVLGFAELALAFKFLSNADLVMHWGLLKREVFIAVWFLCGLGLTLFLFGLFSFKGHSKPKLSVGRKIFGAVSLLFTLYLVPGLTNTKYANLSLISGFPPPLYYSIYPKAEGIYDLNILHDYEEALEISIKENKPLLIDFTGYACVNCRRMEENVWSDPAVKDLMKQFVIVSLYVDDKKNLPLSRQFVYTSADGNEKSIKTIGSKWATFQTENFKNNSQPLYALLNTREQLLNFPVGYTPSSKEYASWLQCGLDTFRK